MRHRHPEPLGQPDRRGLVGRRRQRGVIGDRECAESGKALPRRCERQHQLVGHGHDEVDVAGRRAIP